MQLYPAASIEDKLGFTAIRQHLLDGMRSTLGVDALAEQKPSSDIGWVIEELDRVDELQQALTFDDPVPLHDVLDIRDVLRRAAPDDALVETDALLAVLRVQRTVRLVKSYVANRREKYPRLFEFVAGFTALAELERHLEGILDDEGNILDHASPELRRIRRTLVQQRNALRESVMRALRNAASRGFATEDQPTLRNGRMVIPVRSEAKRKIQGFVHDVSATGQTVYIEPAASLELNNEVRELELEEHREIERILREATGYIRANRQSIQENVDVLARFDVLQAKARLARELDAQRPAVIADPLIVLKEARNPTLQLHFNRLNASSRRASGGKSGRGASEEASRSVVPLTISLGETHHTLLITGPNAGGKTVAMKTVGLLALMVAYGMPIPVHPSSRIGLFSHLIVDIGDEQSIEDDLSTFSSHVTNLRYMLNHADERSLVLMDEAGTGTDPAEGGALAQAILETLTERNTCTLATTHHGTLKVFAYEHEGVENGSMAFDQETLSPTYRFRPGVPGSSYAFEIAQRIGLESSILDRARALVGSQKTALEDLIVSFERRNETLQRRLDEAEAALKKAEHVRRSFEGRAQKLKKEEDQIREKALDEAQRIVQEANARVERTIREIKEAEAEREATRHARQDLEAYKGDVQSARQDLGKKQQRRARKQKASFAPADEEAVGLKPVGGPIREGDQVVLDGGSTAAEVLEVDGKEAVIATGQMRLRVKVKRLSKVGGPRKQRVEVRQVRSTEPGEMLQRIEQRLDLRGQRVDEALQAVERFVDQALTANLNQLEILHGKGTGALREAIQSYLSTRPDVASYEDAPWDQGGPGVTYVDLG